MLKPNQIFIKLFLNKYYEYIFPPKDLDPDVDPGKIYVFENYEELVAFLSQYIDNVDEDICKSVIAGKTSYSGKIVVYQHVCHKVIKKCQEDQANLLTKHVNNHK